MSVRFYNPGTKIFETLRFDHPTNDPKKQNNVSFFQLDVPAKSFFDVPTIVEIPNEGGEPIELAVKFADRIQTDYKEYGLIRVDPKRKQFGEDDNVAPTEKEAQTKGDRFWKDYLVAKAREWYRQVEEVHAVGGVPTRARGVHAHALKVLGMEDPADKVGIAVGRKQDNDEMDDLKAQIAELKTLIKGK